eukprot:981222-Amphidinium_carterae.10
MGRRLQHTWHWTGATLFYGSEADGFNTCHPDSQFQSSTGKPRAANSGITAASFTRWCGVA